MAVPAGGQTGVLGTRHGQGTDENLTDPGKGPETGPEKGPVKGPVRGERTSL